eukprot:SAG31_NODE_155_length_22130_cov_9.540098_1_plen_85_part_00
MRTNRTVPLRYRAYVYRAARVRCTRAAAAAAAVRAFGARAHRRRVVNLVYINIISRHQRVPYDLDCMLSINKWLECYLQWTSRY